MACGSLFGMTAMKAMTRSGLQGRSATVGCPRSGLSVGKTCRNQNKPMERTLSAPTQDAYDAACKALWKWRDESARLRVALEKIAAADTYKGSGSPSTKLGRAIDIARLALSR